MIFFLAEACVLFAQAPGWTWAKNIYGTDDETGYSVAVDLSGNVFVAGYFGSRTLKIGSITLTNAGAENVFIAKFDASGNVLWAKSAGGTYYDDGMSVTTDISGNAYLTGYFGSSTITFGSTTLTNAGSYDIFIAKYDPNGNVLWAKGVSGSIEDQGSSVIADPSGNSFVTGYFNSLSLTFGTITVQNISEFDIFLAKYDAGGNVLWAKGAGGNNDDYAYSVAADPTGNAFVAGAFDSPTITFGTVTLTNAGGVEKDDVFIAKYDAGGNVLWAKSAGGTDDDEAFSVTADALGNAYLTGYFSSSHITFGATVLTNTGGENIFLVKYDPNGNVLWAKNEVGVSDEANSVTTDASGNIYVAGYFGGASSIFGTDTLTNAGTENIFLAKYDTGGNVLWAKGAGGTGSDMAYSVAVGFSGETYMTGYFSSPTIAFGSSTLTNAGNTDVFLAKAGNSLGVDDKVSQGSITLYPNPARDAVYLETNGSWNKELQVSIYSITGQLIWSSTLAQNQRQIHLEDLQAGVYFVSVRSGDNTAFQKLLIRR